MTRYSFLFQPGRIGSAAIKNRFVMAPMGIGALTGFDGLFSERAMDYYEARARGGVGLIITTVCIATNRYEPWESDGLKMLPTFDNLIITRNLKRFTDRIHDHGCTIFAQLTAGWGRVYRPSLIAMTGHEPFAPSSVPLFWEPEKMSREMTIDEIEGLIAAMARSAFIAREGGFDGIELHGHEGYLLDQFKSALWNKRTDAYGGELAGRMTFSLSIIRKIREAAGYDFPVSYRYGLEHRIDGGREKEEGLQIAKMLERAGISALHVDVGCYENWHWPHPPEYQPPGCMVDAARAVKEIVGIPVITVGRLGYPDLANEILEKGYADFVAIGRPLLADPEFEKKCRNGRESEIRPCIGCHECFRRIYQSRSISCAVNPACGDERLYAIRKSDLKKKVMVIGGGIAGLEAARVSALRGHDVTLYEKSTSLGGLLNIIGRNSLKCDYQRLLEFQINQVRKAGVRLCLGQAVDIHTVKNEGPDVVFLATGSVPAEIFRTTEKSPISCVSALDVLCGNAEIGSSIVIVGGGATGCEIAVELADGATRVAICEQLSELAPDLFHANRGMILEQLAQKDVRIFTDTRFERITSRGVVVTTKDGSESLLEADTVIVSIGMKAANALLPGLNEIVGEVHSIGDCVSPRRVKDAVWEAFKNAIRI